MISLNKMLSGVFATAAVVGIAAAPAQAATVRPHPVMAPNTYVIRTGIVAYDESQCSCTYTKDYLGRIISMVQSMPLVKGVTSYYDTTISTRTRALTRPTSASNYLEANSNGTTFWSLEAGDPIHVLCWTDATDGGGQIDKVAGMHIVNGVNNMTIFDVPDDFVTAAVRYSGNHC